MPGQRTDASIAFSVTDNLSMSIVGMKNSLNEFKSDAQGLQQQLDTLTNMRFQLKNFDLKQAQQELARTKRAFEELGDAATDAEREAARADFKQAYQNYENVRAQLNSVSRQARQTERDLLDATDAISKADNRAGQSAAGGGLLSALGQAGAYALLGDTAGQWAQALVSSAFGSTTGSLFSGALSGAGQGAAIGSMIAPGLGTAVGAALGGALGIVQSGSQVYQQEDEAFRSYYNNLYQQGEAAAQESLTTGSATAAQRELDAIAFNRLLGEGVGDQYLADLRTLAADTPLEYSDLTEMSRALATGFGDSPERMLELMQAIGDAGSAVGVTASDMTAMAQAMSRMNSSGKATLEYLNIFQDRGVDVIGMLSEAMERTQGEIYDMISRGEINGQDAASIIQQGMESAYGGAMEVMADTFSGLTSTLEDAMAEIDAARGEGYNTTRSQGLAAESADYGGELGEALQELGRISGQNQAYLENLSGQFSREALSAVLLGEGTTLFSQEDQAKLDELREQYLEASELYRQGNEEAGLVMENVKQTAESLATAAYESSQQYQLMHDAELDQIEAIRENTAALQGWRNDYETQQVQSKGRAVGVEDVFTAMRESGLMSVGTDVGSEGFSSHAAGLRRVPYDNYAALLHQGERVLTASQAREMDRSSSNITVHVSGNTFGAGMDETAVAEAIADAAARKLLAGFRA